MLLLGVDGLCIGIFSRIWSHRRESSTPQGKFPHRREHRRERFLTAGNVLCGEGKTSPLKRPHASVVDRAVELVACRVIRRRLAVRLVRLLPPRRPRQPDARDELSP